MSKLSKIILNIFLVGTIFFLGSYFGYKSNNVELPGLFYTGLVSLAGLIITALVTFVKKIRNST
ncbi:hypothetical protein [Bacillus stratosphericus]|uniref:hypothetical protein n=1 Tax=Bacillus stratosphericus TaxID=293386 RepID=UPI001CFB8202|nr:hypothetical protein [Bacillus stratosphericus]